MIQIFVPPSYLSRWPYRRWYNAKVPAWALFPPGQQFRSADGPSLLHGDWKGTITPQQQEWRKIWLQKFPAYSSLSTLVLGNCCYIEVTDKLWISRETAKIRHLHLLVLLFTLPVSNTLNGCSGSRTAHEPWPAAQLNAASCFPICRGVKLCFHLLTIPSFQKW